MPALPGKELSLWRDLANETTYAPLSQDLTIDVAIIGGGITGLSAAYLLKRAGQRVAVIEKDSIGSGTTGHTTGKVTSQHGVTYNDLKNRLGEKTARIYGEANQTALDRIADVIKVENIDCDWQRADNYVYTTEPDLTKTFRQEALTAASLGLPASYETELDLPFEIHGAVKFAAQAKMNAQKYVHGLARAVNGHGSFVFEGSRIMSIRDGRPAQIRTRRAKLTAKNVIVATNVPTFPLAARGAYCALEYPHTSYIIACRTGAKLSGMYISPDKNHYSILPVNVHGERLLLIGGANHIPGLKSADKRFRVLADYAQKQFAVTEIVYRWKARDYLAYDAIPLIGKLYPWSRHLYVATAFKKWGLTTSMVAGTILSDLILARPNPWADIFNSQRLGPIESIPRVIAKSFGK